MRLTDRASGFCHVEKSLKIILYLYSRHNPLENLTHLVSKLSYYLHMQVLASTGIMWVCYHHNGVH